MTQLLRSALIALVVLPLAACSGESQPTATDDQDHVWKETVDTMDRAKGVEKQLQDAARRQADAVE